MAASQDTSPEALYAINKKFISDDPSNSLPAVTLPDGSKVQTGTVGALLVNIKLYDRVCAGEMVEGLSCPFPMHSAVGPALC